MRAGGPTAIGGGGLLLLLLLAYAAGIDPTTVLEVATGPQVSTDSAPPGQMGAPADELGQFSSTVLASTEDVWSDLFRRAGSRYVDPTLVLFSGAVQSACGFTGAAVGPFYCPADRKLYIDLSFFADLDRNFAAPGDFAQAYVIAHEVGHHVQNLLGISERVRALQQRASREDANALSVRLELQADCFAGVWGYHANRVARMLEPGDAEEGLRAAAAIGDDRMQRRSGGEVQPESWTHGSSQMRARWLRRGLQGGDMEDCDTFSDDQL
jgi:predicted metalloprotease